MKLDQLLALILPVIAFLVNKSNALYTSTYVELPDHPNEGDTYAWIIGKDEERRINELLEHDISDLDFLGFYMTAPPQLCGHCGKKTEVIDWMYTALNRGVHSKEWIVQAIREGTISRKAAHDVYCSRCGHFTVFRDHSGDEGPAPHIAEAVKRAPFDRASKTFIKRDSEGSESTAGDPIKSARVDLEERASEFAGSSVDSKGAWKAYWLIKESAAEDAVKRAVTEIKAPPSTEADKSGAKVEIGWPGGYNWFVKESAAEEVVKRAITETKAPLFTKADELAGAEFQGSWGSESWLIRESAAEKAVTVRKLALWAPYWLLKKSSAEEAVKKAVTEVETPET